MDSSYNSSPKSPPSNTISDKEKEAVRAQLARMRQAAHLQAVQRQAVQRQADKDAILLKLAKIIYQVTNT